MAAPKPQISPSELETLLLDVVAAQEQAVTATQIRGAIPKAIRPPAKKLTAALDALVDEKRLFRIGKRFGTQSLHEQIVSAARREALTATEIRKRLNAPAREVGAAIRELVANGALHAHPKKRYAAHPPTAADLLLPHLDRLLAAAKKLGIAEAEAKNALRQLVGGGTSSSADPIVAAIRDLEHDGALVYLPHLRTALRGSFNDKATFDRAVLTLLARGTVQLQSHPTPSLLGAAERDAMIEDGRGGYFSAIGLR